MGNLRAAFALFSIFAGTQAFGAAAKDDALCRQGKRPIDLSSQFPKYKEQTDGACYSMSATSLLEASLYRKSQQETGKGKNTTLSETYNLLSSVLGANTAAIDNRRQNVKESADRGSNEQFTSGGRSIDVLDKLLHAGEALQASPDDSAKLTQFNNELTAMALAREDSWLSFLDFSKKNTVAQQLRNKMQAQINNLKKSPTVELKGLTAKTASFSFQDPAPKSPSGPIESFLNAMLNPRSPNPKDPKNPYKRDGLTQIRATALSMVHMAELNAEETAVNKYIEYNQLRAPNLISWSPNLSDRAVDGYFKSDINAELMKEFVKKNGAYFSGKTPEEKAQDLVEKMTRTRDYRNWIAKLYPEAKSANATGSASLDKKKAHNAIQKKCDDVSQGSQKAILESLCQGIPVSAGFLVSGVQKSVANKTSAKGWSWVRESTPDLTQHEAVIQGLSTENGVPYLILRNTWPGSHMIRFPLSESCRVLSLTSVLTPQERGEKRTNNEVSGSAGEH